MSKKEEQGMSKKLLCMLLAVMMVAVSVLSGCGGSKDDSEGTTSGEVVVNIKTNPKTWDPALIPKWRKHGTKYQLF